MSRAQPESRHFPRARSLASNPLREQYHPTLRVLRQTEGRCAPRLARPAGGDRDLPAASRGEYGGYRDNRGNLVNLSIGINLRG